MFDSYVTQTGGPSPRGIVAAAAVTGVCGLATALLHAAAAPARERLPERLADPAHGGPN